MEVAILFESLIAPKLWNQRLTWYGNVMKKDESHVVKKTLLMSLEGNRKIGEWPLVCVNECGVDVNMIGDRKLWHDIGMISDPN